MLQYIFSGRKWKRWGKKKYPMSFDRTHVSSSDVFLRTLWCMASLWDSGISLGVSRAKTSRSVSLDGNRVFPPHLCFRFECFLPKAPSSTFTLLGCWLFFSFFLFVCAHPDAFLNGYSYLWRLKWLNAFWEEHECHPHKTAQELAPLSPIICLIKAKDVNTEGEEIKAWHVKANLRMTAMNPGLVQAAGGNHTYGPHRWI